MSHVDMAAIEDRLAEKSVNANYALFTPLGGGLAIAGLALFVLALLGDGSHRAWQTFHVNWVFWTGLTAGSISLTAVSKIANAKWNGPLIRFSQASSSMIPVSLIGLVLVLTLGYHDIYGHMQEALHGVSAGKARWLSRPWMTVRMIGALGLLYWIGYRLVRADLLPDLARVKSKVTGAKLARYERMLQGYDAEANHERIYRLAPLYAVLYSIVLTIVAFDGMMALQPHWFSNLFGGWYFMGSFLGGYTLMAVMMLHGAGAVGIEDYISPKQRHDLGKMVFGFTVFWMYLLWAQFLVIWYGNLPEETGFIFSRLWGPWRPVGGVVFVGMFLMPFAGLLSVGAKKTRLTLGLFATISLMALWLERYLMVIPSVTEESGPVFGLPEVGPTLMFVGLFLLSYAWFARTYPMVSPRLSMITLEKERGH
ncbi:MAG TPA: hypothetical protein VFN22_06040 [Gemmatimonadales bacterium]|nr:hypothetical protein [Gemmatimonadales bacterium]